MDQFTAKIDEILKPDESMEAMVEKLNEASDAYYNGREIMSNLEYDTLLYGLEQLERVTGTVLPNSPTKRVGAPVTGDLPKFKHTYPALSLDKTKDTAEFISRFEKGIIDSGESNKKVVLMWKEDGSTVQAYYKDGKLDKLTTRGNGEVGSIITHNVAAISGIPKMIPVKGEVVVRGEALISYEDFNRINEALPDDQKFKNPRNLASASIQMLDPAEVAKRHVIVKAFNLVHIDANEHKSLFAIPTDSRVRELSHTFSGRLSLLKEFGFNVVEHEVVDVECLDKALDKMTEAAKHYPYPVDGLVAAMDNSQYASTLVGTEHHPHIMQGYAFKWADEAIETVLREIEWSPSRTGLLNPVAIFDPVEIDGTTVKRASVHNLSIMREMNLKVGDRITVYKSNLIIPQVAQNLDSEKDRGIYDDEDFLLDLIGKCPTCGAPAKIRRSAEGIETVYCPDESCPEKLIGNLAHFCERDCMDIQGMSEETIKKFVEAGFIKEYADFFTLNRDIARLPGFGIQSFENLDKASKNAQTTDFVKFITALSIPNIGKGQAKTLKKYLSEHYEDLCNVAGTEAEPFDLCRVLSYLGDMKYDFSQIDGFGKIMSDSLVDWLGKNFNMSDPDSTPELRVWHLLTFTDQPVSKSLSNTAISGKSFCITGKLIHHSNRQALVDKIESFGGKWVDSVSSKTDYLINNDVTSSSGKNKKAKDLNIPIISEEDFLKMIGE